MDTGFHHHEVTFGKGFQLVGGEQRSLDHLQGFGGIVSASGYRSRHDGTAAQGFGQYLCRAAVGSEATEYGELSIVHDDLRAFLAVVLVELRERLDNGDDLQSSRAGCREHHLSGFDLGERTELVAEEDTAVLQLTAMLIGYGKYLSV